MTNPLILSIIGYLAGSIPFGYLVGKINHIDIRQYGSGNIGATNISRKLGIKGFLTVGILDFLKSYIFTFYIFSLPNLPITVKLILSISPILGHIFSIFLKFKGGKGVTCTYGVLAAIFGWQFISVWFIIWIVILAISRIMSLTNLIMALSLPIIFWLHFKSYPSVIIALFLTITIFLTHKNNIKKLISVKRNKL